MNIYRLSTPTKLIYGRDIIAQAVSENKEFFSGNILIVSTGRSLERLGYLDELSGLIKKLSSKNSVHIFSEISANPKIKEIQKGIDFGTAANANAVIGFGGGSSIDAAKAIAAGIGMKTNINDLFCAKVIPNDKTLPIIAIPTTAGTGSELSKAAIITDNEKQLKTGVRGENLYPKLAIVDSKYTESIPLNTTMETGFDVFAHAIESYVSKKASPYTDMLSEKAIEIVGKNLPILLNDLENKNARSQMSFASMIMGINLGNVSTALPHRLQYPLGAFTNTSHGAGLAALHTAWIKYEYKYSEQKIKKTIHILTNKDCNSQNEATKTLNDFITDLQLKTKISELGVLEKDVPILASKVTGSIENDAASEDKNIIENIYRDSL